jgi:DNA-binding transcriptional LysR family regulator
VKSFVEMVKQFDTQEYEFAIRETTTRDVIEDVSTAKSEIGILYLSDFNRKAIERILRGNQLEFHPLIQCDTYAYLWKGHPLAGEKSIRPEQLAEYPCLTFEQGGSESFYFNEETLANAENLRIIKATDRASMLNLMVGLNGYTVCSGIICEELNGSDYVAVPFRGGEETAGSRMEIGYIIKQNMIMSNMAQLYIEELKRYLGTIPANIGSTVKTEKQG